MRRFTISLLSVFVVLPVFAGGRLPVVNIASGGVSARAAFGEEIECSLGLVHLKAGNLTAELHDEVATTLEGFTHLFNGLLCATIGSLGSLL